MKCSYSNAKCLSRCANYAGWKDGKRPAKKHSSDSGSKHLVHLPVSTKKGLKPLFEVNELLYAPWWQDHNIKTEQYWYPGVIFNYKVVKDDGEYGIVHHYSVRFDEDNDEVHSIEDACVFLREDHLLSTSSRDKRDGRIGWIGVKNVVDENSNDLWARVVGWYETSIGQCYLSAYSIFN